MPFQISRFSIKNLFGKYEHVIDFPTHTEEAPSVLILHGQNGVGKTRVLRMIEGTMRLDFSSFRDVPFSRAEIEFSNGSVLAVEEQQDHLWVTYQEIEVKLHRHEAGAYSEAYQMATKSLQERFKQDTKHLAFELISTRRAAEEYQTSLVSSQVHPSLLDPASYFSSRQPRQEEPLLRERVASFIISAKADVRKFLDVSAPTLIRRLIDYAGTAQRDLGSGLLLKKLDDLKNVDRELDRFGLGGVLEDIGDLDMLAHGDQSTISDSARLVIGALLEVTEARAQELNLVAKRLEAFEQHTNDMFIDKQVRISPDVGFEIRSGSRVLDERQLSSGERHLLHILIAALVSRRRGTILAIDEPELSLHISWQRKLLPALLACASYARPLLLLATHSADVAANHRMQRLGPKVSER